MPDLSIVIVTWNAGDLLGACLRSLVPPGHGVPRASCEIIVVDNASTDGTTDHIERDFPTLRLIRSATNEGFARANNRGLAASSGRYVMLLNSDTIVPAGTLDYLVDFLDAHASAGACSPRLERPDGSPQPFAYGDDPTLGYLLRRAIARLVGRPLHDWAVAEALETGWVSGAALMARREAIRDAGPLDEAIFMYFEDNDWCLRMRHAGWQVYYVPEVTICHVGGASVAKNPAARTAYYRSLAYFYRKHYGRLARVILGLALRLAGPAKRVQ